MSQNEATAVWATFAIFSVIMMSAVIYMTGWMGALAAASGFALAANLDSLLRSLDP